MEYALYASALAFGAPQSLETELIAGPQTEANLSSANLKLIWLKFR